MRARICVHERSSSTQELYTYGQDSLLQKQPRKTIVGYTDNHNMKLEVEEDILYDKETIPFSSLPQFD